MGYLSQFKISFSGLSQGQHEFNYSIDNKFFEEPAFSGSEIKKAKIDLTVDLLKQSGMLALTFKFKCQILVECDRCLNESFIPVNGEQKLIVKIGEEREHDPKNDDEVIVLPPSETELDISQYIYEYINLLLPYQKIPCEILNDTSLCNQEVIQKLNQFQQQEKEKEQAIDPRWDVLKNLKTKNKKSK